MHTIYCFNNGGSPGFLSAIALADDGHMLASHLCSSEAYMPYDLGLESTSKHEHYNAHFGPGNWQLEWVDEPRQHPGWLAAEALNKGLGAKWKRESEAESVVEACKASDWPD